jgi:hypothetical protein
MGFPAGDHRLEECGAELLLVSHMARMRTADDAVMFALNSGDVGAERYPMRERSGLGSPMERDYTLQCLMKITTASTSALAAFLCVEAPPEILSDQDPAQHTSLIALRA